MTDQPTCGNLTPHPPHRTDRGALGVRACPGVPNLAEPAGEIIDMDGTLAMLRAQEAAQQPLSRDDDLCAVVAKLTTPAEFWEFCTVEQAAHAAVEALDLPARDARVRADERRRVAEELDQARADLAAVQSAIVRIHVQMPDHVAPRLGFEASDLCRADGERWPCPTIRALRPAAPAERVQDAPTDTAGTPECVCDLIDVSVGQDIQFVRGQSNGCLLHPHPRAADIAEAKRRAREAP